MKDKEKQIEEMAFDLIKATSPLGVKDLTETFDYKKVATDLCNIYGWCKLPEDSVVLSREEAEKRIAELEKENAKYNQKLTTNQWVQEIRKEALKEFAEKLKKRTILYSGINVKYEAITADIIDETLKEFIND